MRDEPGSLAREDPHRVTEALANVSSQLHRAERILRVQNVLMILLILTMLGLTIAVAIFTRAVIGEY